MWNILLFLILLKSSSAGDASIIGVPPNKLLLYQPDKDFTCFDGSLTIPFSAVNDDFCDCVDGSDEPGTSACASSIFYCPNKGYYPLNVPSSRVNDGICDCCDGSDEYISKNCSDNCEVLGAQALAEAEAAAELLNKGNSVRLQMSASGKQTRQQKRERLDRLSKELAEAENIKKEADELKNEAEAKESAALEVYREIEEKARLEAAEKEKLEQQNQAKDVFMEMDTDGNTVLTDEELFTKLRSLKSSSAKTDDNLKEEVKFIMDSKSELNFDAFLESTWNRLRSLLVMEETAPPESEVEDHQEPGENEEEHEQEDEHPEEEEEERHEDDNESEREHEGEVEEEHYGPKPAPDSTVEYDEETKRLVEEANKARQHFDQAERSWKDIERDITTIKEFLEKDYGPDDEFLSLEGQCFSYSDREYTYKLCPFDQVVQSGRQGGSETRLGTWKSWQTPGDYSTMIYDRGQSCWNGPQRSAKIHLTCGLDNEVIGAAEPNKCEYVLDFRTPAACRPAKHSKYIRDEL